MEQRRNYGYDILRVIAISMVVAIHANAAYLWQKPAGSLGALLTLQITALCVSSVPVFFMLSGALLLDVPETVSLKDLFRKRLRKQFIPFALWSVIYTVVRIITGKIPLSFTSFLDLFNEPAYSQFWFMYTLLGIYLILPFLQILVNKLTQNRFRYLLILWFVFSILIPLLSHYTPFRLSNHVDLVLSEGYIGYFLLGFYLKKYRSETSGTAGLLLFAAGTVITGITVWIEWLNTNVENAVRVGNTYGNYLLPGAVLSAIGLFLFFQNNKTPSSNKTKAVISELSLLTMGVFYIHMLVLTALDFFGLIKSNVFWMNVCKCVMIIVISFCVSFLISKIPIINTLLLGVKKKRGENH